MADVDKWVDIAKECKYLNETDLKVGDYFFLGWKNIQRKDSKAQATSTKIPVGKNWHSSLSHFQTYFFRSQSDTHTSSFGSSQHVQQGCRTVTAYIDASLITPTCPKQLRVS